MTTYSPNSEVAKLNRRTRFYFVSCVWCGVRISVFATDAGDLRPV